jgi:hypothetical protein
VVPAIVDQMQEHALEALQALKVVDPDVEAGEICTRREYARWLIAASSKLSRYLFSQSNHWMQNTCQHGEYASHTVWTCRSSVHKVFPAMYIENITDLAFDDVPVEDPDFPFIQGCTAVLSPSCTFCEITSVRSCLRATFFVSWFFSFSTRVVYQAGFVYFEPKFCSGTLLLRVVSLLLDRLGRSRFGI